MAEISDNTRRWNGFVCPDCRFIFRIPRDHEGRGVVCPGCRRMLKVPGDGEVTPPLFSKGRKLVREELPQAPAPAAAAAPEAPERRRSGEHRKRSHAQTTRQPDESDWGKSRTSHRKGGRNTARWIAVSCVLGLTLLAAATAVFVSRRASPAPPPRIIRVEPRKTPQSAEVTDNTDEVLLPQNLRGKEAAGIEKQLEAVARTFLDADTIPKVLPLVRDPAGVEKKLRILYPDGRVPAAGLSEFATKGNLVYEGNVFSIYFRTKDYEERLISFVRTPDGMKVDWESYAGWSDMPWEKFIAEKTQKPVLFRTMLKKDEYYNFAFADEEKWQCYQMTSPDGLHTLYGYVRKDSPTALKLLTDGENRPVPVTVELRFQGSDNSRNQVIIDDVVEQGWVTGLEKAR